MNMDLNGWIKVERIEIELLKGLTDPEIRYFLAARLACIWDRRSKLAGTFDARTHIVRAEMLPNWSTGKINMVKNSLLRKGYLAKTSDPRRLKIQRIERVKSEVPKIEEPLQETDKDVQPSEDDLQKIEARKAAIREMVNKLTRSKGID